MAFFISFVISLFHFFPSLVLSANPDSSNCTTRFFTQKIDHFNAKTPLGNKLTYQQRYLLCGLEWWKKDISGAIFFYSGNEGDVTLYANYSGLLWENAPNANALILFAEHRYYGESLPYGPNPSVEQLQYLSSAQALADYAILIREIKREYGADEDQPVITFGGSYGGVLSAFFRAKYPSTVQGAVASSGPLRAFPGQYGTPWDSALYYAVPTRDATAAGGNINDNCATNVRNAFPIIFNYSTTTTGLQLLSSTFSTCKNLSNSDDVIGLAQWIRGTFDVTAMGSYPYPSSYMTGGAVYLPAFPLRATCDYAGLNSGVITDEKKLLSVLAASMAVFNNATKDVPCYDIAPNYYSHPDQPVDGIWDYQRCNELQPDSAWFTSNGITDMFYDEPYNESFTTLHCQQAWGITPDLNATSTFYGLPSFHGLSNIIFSNGILDSWSGASIQISPSFENNLIVVNYTGGHHQDLFFSNDADPSDIKQARRLEISYVTVWLEQARQNVYRKRKLTDPSVRD